MCTIVFALMFVSIHKTKHHALRRAEGKVSQMAIRKCSLYLYATGEREVLRSGSVVSPIGLSQ